MGQVRLGSFKNVFLIHRVYAIVWEKFQERGGGLRGVYHQNPKVVLYQFGKISVLRNFRISSNTKFLHLNILMRIRIMLVMYRKSGAPRGWDVLRKNVIKIDDYIFL